MADPQPRKQPYRLYAANGRVYAQNITGAIIDLGVLAQNGAQWRYLLDGNKLHADGFGSSGAALHHIASRLHFLWIDGQFTALPDVRASVDLKDAEQLDIELDELGPGERIEDATV